MAQTAFPEYILIPKNGSLNKIKENTRAAIYLCSNVLNWKGILL